MYNDDIIIWKNGKDIKNLIQAIGISSEDTGIRFAIRMCHADNKKGKKEEIEVRELINPERGWTLGEKETRKKWNRGSWHHPKSRDKEKLEKRTSNEQVHFSETGLVGDIISKVFPFVWYSGTFLKETKA